MLCRHYLTTTIHNEEGDSCLVCKECYICLICGKDYPCVIAFSVEGDTVTGVTGVGGS